MKESRLNRKYLYEPVDLRKTNNELEDQLKVKFLF